MAEQKAKLPTMEELFQDLLAQKDANGLDANTLYMPKDRVYGAVEPDRVYMGPMNVKATLPTAEEVFKDISAERDAGNEPNPNGINATTLYMEPEKVKAQSQVKMATMDMPAQENHSVLDANWDALSPEKKAELQALVTKLDMAKDYKGGEGAMGAGGPTGQKAYLGIAALGGLPPEQLTALARFRQYNLNQASDPNWQGPPQAPVTGPAAPAITIRPREDLNKPVPPGMVTRTGMTQDQATRSDIDNRYAMLAKPGPKTEQKASVPDPPPADEAQAVGQSFLQMLMDLAKGKK